MSLFKAREWWSTVSGYEEFHSTGSLLIAPVVTNNDKSKNVIFVGSLSGMLRAYAPSGGGFSLDHLLLEMQLSSPVIKVEQADINGEGPIIVLLHTREVCLYSYSLEEDQLSLSLLIQHPLHYASYDMVIGKFGRSKNDLICVQTLNGQLQILDQGKELFTCRLSDTIVPGPLAYVPRTDTIVTISSSRYLDGYRYQSLSTRSQTKKPFKADWSLSLGEPVLDIKSIMLDDSHSVLLILGERNVFCLKETGAIVFSLRLDTYFTTIFPYSSTYTGDGDHISCMYMLAGHSQQLQVFNNQVMVWSAQLTHPPVSLHVGQFDGLDGVVVTMDELGHLQCSYLGTDPTSLLPTFTALTSASVEELEGELKQLQSAIDEADQKGAIISTDCVIEVKSVIYSEPRPLESEDGLNQQCVEATVTLKSSNSFKINLTVFVDVAPPISAHPTSLSLNVTDDDKFILTFVCSGDSGWPDTNKANIILSYDNQNHTHRIDHTLSLPIGLLCKPVQPQDGQYKITLDSTHNCVPLIQLYSLDEGEGQPNAVAFQLISEECITMVASKSSNRYRLQSDSFAALNLFAEDLVDKLRNFYKKEEKFKLSLSGNSLPLQEYFECIDDHYKVRVGLKQCKELLSRYAHQFRAIQKRLLTRFKDKTPAGLINLDTLLDGTFMQMMALTEKCEELQLEESYKMRLLNSASNLLILLLQLSTDLTPQDVVILRHTLTPPIGHNADHGWEEVVDVAVTQLLKTVLSKGVKDHSVNLPELELPLDCKKIKRHIALMCDRIIKGGHLVATGTQSLTNGPHQPLSPLVEQHES